MVDGREEGRAESCNFECPHNDSLWSPEGKTRTIVATPLSDVVEQVQDKGQVRAE